MLDKLDFDENDDDGMKDDASRKSSRDSDVSKSAPITPRLDKIAISGFKTEKDIDLIKEHLKEYAPDSVQQKSVVYNGEDGDATSFTYELFVSDATKVIDLFNDTDMLNDRIMIEHLREHSGERKRKPERLSNDSLNSGDKKVTWTNIVSPNNYR